MGSLSPGPSAYGHAVHARARHQGYDLVDDGVALLLGVLLADGGADGAVAM